MSEHFKTLLRTPIPYKDESLAGYIIRLAEINYYQSPNWILNLAGLKANKGIYLYDNLLEPSLLSKLVRLDDKQLCFMTLLAHDTVNESNYRHYKIYKYGVRLCPQCLKEFNYSRKIWDWYIVKACALHQCKLIYECPNCQKKIKWARPGVSLCKCGFDFRSHTPEKADIYQMNLSLYLHKLDSYFKKSIGYG